MPDDLIRRSRAGTAVASDSVREVARSGHPACARSCAPPFRFSFCGRDAVLPCLRPLEFRLKTGNQVAQLGHLKECAAISFPTSRTHNSATPVPVSRPHERGDVTREGSALRVSTDTNLGYAPFEVGVPPGPAPADGSPRPWLAPTVMGHAEDVHGISSEARSGHESNRCARIIFSGRGTGQLP